MKVLHRKVGTEIRSTDSVCGPIAENEFQTGMDVRGSRVQVDAFAFPIRIIGGPKNPARAEIDDDRAGGPGVHVTAYQDVVGLEVAVHHTASVHVIESL